MFPSIYFCQLSDITWKLDRKKDKSYFIVLLIFVFFFHPLFSDIMYLNFIQHDWRKYYNISKASTWLLQNKSNGIAQERKSKFQFLSDLIYVLLFYVCFSFYNFFFISSESRMLCFIATTNKKKEKFSIVLFSVYYFTFYLIFEFIVEMLFFLLLFRLVRWMAYMALSGLYIYMMNTKKI